MIKTFELTYLQVGFNDATNDIYKLEENIDGIVWYIGTPGATKESYGEDYDEDYDYDFVTYKLMDDYTGESAGNFNFETLDELNLKLKELIGLKDPITTVHLTELKEGKYFGSIFIAEAEMLPAGE